MVSKEVSGRGGSGFGSANVAVGSMSCAYQSWMCSLKFIYVS